MKKTSKTNKLSQALHDFFVEHLPRLRGMSPNTIHSYRDCLVLLLRFAANKQRCAITKLEIENFDAKLVINFLQMLEDERGNKPATRNIRLAAIHVFFRYFASNNPEQIAHCQRIIAIPFKRSSHRIVEYLEYNEIQAVLTTVDQTSRDGRRDYALLVTMFNTGARVQEILDLKVCDLQLFKPYHAHLIGKGRKERLCPLWSQTAKLLENLLKTRTNCHDEHIFLNHNNRPLTRFGVRYLLAKYCDLAKKTTPSLVKKRLHPHSMRHSTAIHLLKAGVDIVTISHWLGHTSINTTNRYTNIDLDIKREAINKITLETKSKSKIPWQSDASILKWLESL